MVTIAGTVGDMDHRSLLVASALVACLGCTPKNQEEAKPAVVCTALGCSSGVIVHLAPMPMTTFRVELVPSGGSYGTRYAFDCERAEQCTPEIMFPEIITQSARVKVTTPSGSRETEFRNLVYTSRHPNGPRCGPECRQANVTPQLPE